MKPTYNFLHSKVFKHPTASSYYIFKEGFPFMYDSSPAFYQDGTPRPSCESFSSYTFDQESR